jgi:pyrimidine deaminase RibD-like protein
MEKYDLKWMREAIKWADACHPIKPSIPKVGAIIALGDKPLGRGRRGTGTEGDDQHAEWHAIREVQDNSKLRQATLYTTLEPCTPEVRSKPLECCTELIRQHKIKKVFVGTLDPNQGVTGKGLLRLQESGVEVALFPHNLSEEILIQNAAFIRSQQTLGATILSPKNGEDLRTYDSGGRHAVRFKSLNPPGPDTYLLAYQGGSYWPQLGLFRQREPKVWEIDAHFGTTGEYVLQLVTANELGSALIRYYQKVVEGNRGRRARLRGKIDLSLLGDDYPGIQMSGLPKGHRLEASVTVFIAYKVSLLGTSIEPQMIARGKSLKIKYEIECSENVAHGVWLGASFKDDKTGRLFHNVKEDKAVALTKGKNTCERILTIAKDAPLGDQMLATSLWRGIPGDSKKSKWIAGRAPLPIKVVQ